MWSHLCFTEFITANHCHMSDMIGAFIYYWLFPFLSSLFEILQSLYWAVYGLVDLEHAHLDEPHKLTELIGKLMFGSYSMIAIIILLNLLIAMMSNSYQLIYVRLIPLSTTFSFFKHHNFFHHISIFILIVTILQF